MENKTLNIKTINMLAIALLIITSGILTSGCSLVGMKTTEEAPYNIISKDGDFQIRQYPALTLARVKKSVETKTSENDSFRELFRYISGDNISQEKISMTAPVISKEQSSEKISMTAPVLMKKNEQSTQMSFILPRKYNLASAPKPKSDKLEIVELEGAKRIVYTFSGILNDESVQEGKAKLLEYIKRNNIKVVSSTILSAGYNPPWTLPPLRRNEILIDIQE